MVQAVCTPRGLLAWRRVVSCHGGVQGSVQGAAWYGCMAATASHQGAFACALCVRVHVVPQLGVGVDAVALGAVMAQPFKPMVLSGAATGQQLTENAGQHV